MMTVHRDNTKTHTHKVAFMHFERESILIILWRTNSVDFTWSKYWLFNLIEATRGSLSCAITKNIESFNQNDYDRYRLFIDELNEQNCEWIVRATNSNIYWNKDLIDLFITQLNVYFPTISNVKKGSILLYEWSYCVRCHFPMNLLRKKRTFSSGKWKHLVIDMKESLDVLDHSVNVS